MEMLEGAVRNYDWGSPSAIPDLLGRPRSDQPVAELWLGAHPGGAACVGPMAQPLDELISEDPAATLGADVAARFESLPFLLKILAADSPLSLQAHPSTEQAIVGYERENAAGIALDAPERSFPDRTHKPELVCALSPFEALYGLRDSDATLDLLAGVDTSALDPVRDRIAAAPGRVGLRAALTWLLTLDETEASSLTTAVVTPLVHAPGPHRPELALAVELAGHHPGDVGAVTALLLNQVCLEPGQALYLGAGTLHSYVSGMAVELMANSDNVLRGGLTTKPVDVFSLLEIVETEPVVPVIQDPTVVDGVAAYDSPVPEFALSRFEIDDQTPVETEGPAVLLCVDGAVEAGPHTLDRGAAAWMPACDPPVTLSGRGTLFRAGVGRLALD